MSESFLQIPVVAEGTSLFFVSLSIFTLSGNIQFKICLREEFVQCKIHGMDKICLELATFEEFGIALY